MESKRWKFSKTVQNELEVFFKTVEDLNESENTDKIWQLLLPKIPVSFNDTKHSTEEDISLKNISEQNLSVDYNIPDISVLNLTLAEPFDVEINPNLDDLIEYFAECLNSDILQSDDIKKISNELNVESLKELLNNILDIVNNEGLLKFGHSICRYSSKSSNELKKQYCRIILLPKLTNVGSTKVFKFVLKEFAKLFPEITRQEILLPILNTDYKCNNVYELTLDVLPENEKLLRDFVFSCSELEAFQLLLLQPLLRATNDHSIKRRIIKLMHVSSEKFSIDKLFIKILIELIKSLGKEFIDQEPLLYEIINKNRTLLKNTAETALNEWLQMYIQ